MTLIPLSLISSTSQSVTHAFVEDEAVDPADARKIAKLGIVALTASYIADFLTSGCHPREEHYALGMTSGDPQRPATASAAAASGAETARKTRSAK